MVVRTMRCILSLLIVSACATSFASETLETGRKNLENGNLVEALKSYSTISFRDTEWNAKLEDLIRYQLIRGAPDEAWRLVQLAKRTHRDQPDFVDYERLALFKNGSCALAVEGFSPVRAHLLDAATYRFHAAILKREGASANEHNGALVSGLVPDLDEIPHAKLLAGRGCRIARATLTNEKSIRQSELDSLIEALRELQNVSGSEKDSGTAQLFIKMRARYLAASLRQPKIVEAIDALFPAPETIAWLDLPDVERRWLFAKFFVADPTQGRGGWTYQTIAPEKRLLAQTIAMSIVSDETHPSPVAWLAMIDLATLKLTDKIRLFSKVAQKNETFPERGWVLLTLASLHYEAGHINEVLTLLRRLLREKEVELDDAGEARALNLASQIFAEFRFDANLFGAMRAALPSRLWGRTVDGALAQLAFTGRARDFTRLEKESAQGMHLWRENDVRLLSFLAKRDLRAFQQNLTKRAPHRDPSIVALAGTFATYLIDTDSKNAKAVEPFAHELGSWLRRVSKDDDDVRDLILLLTNDADSWSQSERSVRNGILRLGTAHWRGGDSSDPQFKLLIPPSLPLRELIEVPDRATGRDWKLSVEIR